MHYLKCFMFISVMAGGGDPAAAAALRGWQVYFNTVTIAGRRNVSCTLEPEEVQQGDLVIQSEQSMQSPFSPFFFNLWILYGPFFLEGSEFQQGNGF